MEFFEKNSFHSFSFTPSGEHINGRLLATFDATGVAGGNFCVICAATRPVTFCFSGASIYAQPQLASFEFLFEIEPEDLYFPHNLLSTTWEDLSVAVAEQRVKVFNPTDPQQDDRSFRSLLDSFKEEAHACFRWTICSHNDLSFSLDLQGLPMSATSASSKQALTLDTAPTLKLASHQVVFPSLPSELHIPGPAPTVFSDDPTRSKTLLAHHSPLLRHEVARLSWQFTSREYIFLSRLLSFWAQLLAKAISPGPFVPRSTATPARQQHITLHLQHLRNSAPHLP
jgi:hypothetical protein